MIGSLASVFGLALIDSLNPSALAVTLYLLLAGKPYAPRVLAYAGGIFCANLALGGLLVLGLGSVWGHLDGPVAYAAQGVVGAALVGYAVFAPDKPRDKKRERGPRSVGLGAVFLLGMTITVVEFSTALPYLGAIAILTNADLAAVRWLPVLVAYNLVFVSPPLLLLAAYGAFGSRLRPLMERWREKLRGGSRETLLWIAGIVGFLLLADSLRFFEFFGLVEISNAREGS